MTPLLSIITINLNNYNGLKNTLDSVVAQKGNINFEYIIIDGDSTDGSKQLIEKYSANINYWVSKPDKGIYNAMNKGIKVAKGNYLLFLNSGDCLYQPDTIEKVVQTFKCESDIYYGDIIYNEGNKKKWRTFPEKLDFKFFYKHNISHQAAFIKKVLFETIFYYNEDFKFVSDWEFFTYAICKKDVKYKHIPIITTIYEATGVSSNIDNHQEMYLERAASLKKYFPQFVNDYDWLKELEFKKLHQFLYIKQHRVAYKILKAFINLILLFLPKFKKKTP